jgi:iron(III) transport system ATP-binding protein
MASVQLQRICKSYGDNTVLRDLSLTVNHGECFTLLGPSGCGKTVLLRLVAGFERPDAGVIRIGERVVSDAAASVSAAPNERDLGVVFQDYAVWPHMTVFENIAYPLKLSKVAETEQRTRVMDAVGQVNLQGLEGRMPSQLSGGQQRVALARALAINPDVMLLDEPLSSLDPHLREEMRFEIKDLQRKFGFSIIYVTHDQAEAMALSDRILVMNRGVAQQVDPPLQIYQNPANRFVFGFIGLSNFIEMDLQDDQARLNGHTVSLPSSTLLPAELKAGVRAVLASRPSEIDFVAEGGVRGVVKRFVYLGEIIDYRIDVGGQEVRVQKNRRAPGPREGETCGLVFLKPHWYGCEA